MGKAKFMRPASKTPFMKLPEELNTKILDFAFGVRSRDVASSRLACQHLFVLCSPYLIRTAVVAKRDKTRKKLKEVIRHPYFRNHVTHFLWDASEFHPRIANDDGEYSRRYVEDPHLKRYRVTRSDMVQSDRDDRIEYVKCHEGDPGNSEWNALIRSHYGFDPPIDEARVAEFSMEEKLDLTGDMGEFYSIGSYRGKIEYAARLREQEQHASNGHLFRVALMAFKSLAHVSFSDFRALAYPDESYADLCRRLFGDMACPQLSVLGRAEEFLNFLRNPQRGSWKSISIGHHPFLGNAFDKIHEVEARDWNHRLGHCRLDEILSTEELRLSVSRNAWRENSIEHTHWGFGINMMSKLRELELNFDELRAEEALGEFDSYDRTITFDRARYESWHNRWNYGTHPHVLFRNLLATKSHEFKSLQILTLRNFTFEQAAMHDLLVGLKKLHTLHLIDCLSLETYDGFSTMARTALSASLRLTGVEIYGLRFLEFDHQAEPRPAFDPELRDRTRVKRSLDYDLATACGLLPEFYPFTVRDWPCERPELEDAILGGRHNNILRKVRAAPNQEAKEGWVDIAVRDL